MAMSGETPSATNAGSPERRAWAEIGERGARPAKRVAERTTAPEAIGGATAPLPVGAIHTPPAQKRRMKDFASSASDTDGRLKDLTDMVKDEFTKVWEALQRAEDRSFEFVEQQSMDALQISLDRRLENINSTFLEFDGSLKKIAQEQSVNEATKKIQELEMADMPIMAGCKNCQNRIRD